MYIFKWGKYLHCHFEPKSAASEKNFISKAPKKSRAVSDDDSDSDEGSEAPDKTVAAKLRELGSDSEDDEDRTKMDTGKKDEKTLFGSDSDSDNNEEEWVEELSLYFPLFLFFFLILSLSFPKNRLNKDCLVYS